MFVGWTPSDSVVLGHYIAKLVEGLENVDADTSVKASRFEQPQILSLMLTFGDLVRRFDGFFFRNLHLLHLLIDRVHILIQVLVNQFENVQERFNFVTNVVFKVIQNNCQRDSIVNVQLLALIERLHVEKQIVLCSQRRMAFDMIHELFKSVLAYQIELDSTRCWLPLEVIQTIIVIVCSLPAWECGVSVVVVSRFHPATLFQDFENKFGVVARPDDVFQGLVFILLEPVLG